MHAYTLTGATLHDAFRLGLLPARPIPETPYAHLGTGQVRFNAESRPNTHAVLNALSSGELCSRAKIAKDTELSKNAVRHEVEKLVQEGRICKTESGNMYLYQLTNPNPIRRSPRYWWKRCPVCEKERRLARQPNGDYLHWCGEHYAKVISKEMLK